MRAQAGWYADPRGSQAHRWWDGDSWTGWLSGTGDAQPPPVESADTDPAPAPSRTDPASERLVRWPVAVAVLIGAVVLALVAVSAVVSLSDDRLPRGPGVDPPAPAPRLTEVSFDSASRTAAAEELHFLAPGEPFTCPTEAQPAPPAFTSRFACSAAVHADYNAGHADWAAVVGLGFLAESATVPGELEQTADRAFDAVVAQNYAAERSTVTKRASEPLGIARSGRAVLVSAHVNVRERGLATAYDTVLVAVVALDRGDYAVWFALRPDDTPKATMTVLRSTTETVSALR